MSQFQGEIFYETLDLKNTTLFDCVCWQINCSFPELCIKFFKEHSFLQSQDAQGHPLKTVNGRPTMGLQEKFNGPHYCIL